MKPRLVLIADNTYQVFEGKKFLAEFQSNEPLWPEQIEELRTAEYNEPKEA